MKSNKSTKSLYIWLGICIALILLLNWFVTDSERVEAVYSRAFYPFYQYLPKLIFGLLPVSLGDLLYLAIVLFLLYLVVRTIVVLFKKQFHSAWRGVLTLISTALSLYIFFHLAWAINYYRFPVSKQLQLSVDTILLEDHLGVLEEQIQLANSLRGKLDLDSKVRTAVNTQIEVLMRDDREFSMLSKTQIHIKKPLSSVMISSFGTSGYLNPFSNEAHANVDMPITSYPFTVTHELAHQMGIGLEDECNFIAYVKLRNYQDPWFQYAAYYESIQYLLRSLYLVDEPMFQKYKAKLSEDIKSDLKKDRLYWESYTGWLTNLSGIFYDQYLKHNNQREGMARYGLVSRLIIAYEMNLKNGRGSIR
ncbi:DUF3810 domain-containing protein [Sphingobacterium hotanense]|uniref:DUF3810 domain-containing protein n=1 Tax=Sphingobacterium hotanense TaxID=649196 RepID=A0ABT7NSU5_9SPHI|nr:DUF3810 domain-containing protein [Sphingobacterium hotanense]MDM1050269.1 DUF3810 domain-containing protein [Sphingobacterium hotanense]